MHLLGLSLRAIASAVDRAYAQVGAPALQLCLQQHRPAFALRCLAGPARASPVTRGAGRGDVVLKRRPVALHAGGLAKSAAAAQPIPRQAGDDGGRILSIAGLGVRVGAQLAVALQRLQARARVALGAPGAAGVALPAGRRIHLPAVFRVGDGHAAGGSSGTCEQVAMSGCGK